jgi:hypothetical protein
MIVFDVLISFVGKGKKWLQLCAPTFVVRLFTFSFSFINLLCCAINTCTSDANTKRKSKCYVREDGMKKRGWKGEKKKSLTFVVVC